MPFYPSFNRFYGPVKFLSDGVNPVITINGNPSESGIIQYIQTFDKFGNPIETHPNAGGDAVLGDRRSAFPPGDIFNPSWQVMTATADNVVTNAACFRLGHGTSQGVVIAVGNGAPSAANPISTGMPPNGSFYFRSDGGAGTSVYMARAGAWAAIL